MHEVSIADSILDLISRQTGGPVKLQSLQLRIGALSGVSPEALQFCFPTVANARGFGIPLLEIENVPLQILCLDCQKVSVIQEPFAPCPCCGGFEREIITGHEFSLLSATIEENSNV